MLEKGSERREREISNRKTNRKTVPLFLHWFLWVLFIKTLWIQIIFLSNVPYLLLLHLPWNDNCRHFKKWIPTLSGLIVLSLPAINTPVEMLFEISSSNVFIDHKIFLCMSSAVLLIFSYPNGNILQSKKSLFF